MTKRVLVTGSTGFVGQQVIGPLIKLGYEVHGVSRKKNATSILGLVEHNYDILMPGAIDAILDKVCPTHLLHLAWTPDPGRSLMSLDNIQWASVTLNLFHAFKIRNGIRAVFVGSCAEYDWNYSILNEYTTPLTPETLYGTAKNSVREIIEFASYDTNFSYAWARLFFLYGPHERESRFVASVARALAIGDPIATTDGSHQRDYMHVEDAGLALALLLNSEIVGPINIAAGYCCPMSNILNILGEISGSPSLIEIGGVESQNYTAPVLAADVSRMREELRFIPNYSLESGLTLTYEWWCKKMKSGKFK